MIVCQNCLREHPDGTSYCDACGERLSATPGKPRRTMRPAPSATPGEYPVITPQQLGYGDVVPVAPPGMAGFGDAPGEETTETVNGRGTDGSRPLGKLVVRLNSGKMFELTGKEAYLIGRRDDERRIYPDLDLTEYGGLEAGVSRAHALIHVRPDGYLVEDLQSTNETLLNFQRLLPGQSYPLKDGDQLRLGALAALIVIG